MKKLLFVTIALMTVVGLGAQNVGIGTNTPLEKLDINGNLNINGNLKINGVGGQNGQVLMTNAEGKTIWENAGNEYKNVVVFHDNGVWNIPVGVTKIMIEIWGGGGGGALGGGGGSGVYIRRMNLSLPAGTALTITIGTGGNGASSINNNGSNGNPTTINYTYGGSPNTIVAQGGGGAYSNIPGTGLISGSPSNGTNSLFIPGNHGQPSRYSYSQMNATDFVRIINYGDGGDAAYINCCRGSGGVNVFNTDDALTINEISSRTGSGFGAGGGGGFNGYAYGGHGANGRVHIWY
jgi:hypothetical protein